MGKALVRDGDVISGAVLSALGLYIFLQAHQWDYSGPDGPGPGFFPTWYGLGMIALSLAMIGQRIRRGALAAGTIDHRGAPPARNTRHSRSTGMERHPSVDTGEPISIHIRPCAG